MNQPCSESDKLLDWRFLAAFAAYLSVLLLLTQFPLSLLEQLKTVTGRAVALAGSLLLLPVRAYDDLLEFQTFPMQITLECTALHYATFFTAGVLAHRARPSYKLLGIAAGVAGIFLLNIVRIMMLGMIGHHLPSLFEFVHIYLWQGAFALLTLLMWIVWSDRKGTLSLFIGNYLLVASAVALCTLAALVLLFEEYAAVLAGVAALVIDPLSRSVGSPFTVAAAGRAVLYAAEQGGVYNNIGDVFNAVIFTAIAGGLFLRDGRQLLWKQTSLGLGMLFLQHVLYVVLYGFMLMNTMEEDVFSISLWALHGISMAAPFMIWVVVLNVPFRKAE